jgi:hypothetical protein
MSERTPETEARARRALGKLEEAYWLAFQTRDAVVLDNAAAQEIHDAFAEFLGPPPSEQPTQEQRE